MNDAIYFINLHDRQFKLEILLNITEIVSIVGSKTNAPGGGCVVTMTSGDEIDVFEGTNRIAELLSGNDAP